MIGYHTKLALDRDSAVAWDQRSNGCERSYDRAGQAKAGSSHVTFGGRTVLLCEKKMTAGPVNTYRPSISLQSASRRQKIMTTFHVAELA
jgi:hypothetical protein